MPFILAFPVSKTDVPETDALRRMPPRRMSLRRMSLRRRAPRRRKAETEEAEGVFLKPSRRLQWLLLISFERCEWVQRCVSLVDDSSGVYVGGWLVGWVCIGAYGGLDGRQSMSSDRIYFRLLNCSHSVYKVIN